MNPKHSPRIITLLSVVVALSLWLLSGCSIPQVKAEDRVFLNLSLAYVSEYRLPRTDAKGTAIANLSNLIYIPTQAHFYAIGNAEATPDNTQGQQLYQLQPQITEDQGEMHLEQVQIESVTPLAIAQTQVFTTDQEKAQGLALPPSQSIFVAGEEQTDQGDTPFIAAFNRQTGAWQQSLALPDYFSPAAEPDAPPQGIVPHHGLKALTMAPEGDRVFTATEVPLQQDQGQDVTVTPKNRLLHYLVGNPGSFLISEHVYPLQPEITDATDSSPLSHGLVALAVVDGMGHFLSLERSYHPSTGYGAQIFQFTTGGATDISQVASLEGTQNIIPVRKRLLLDLNQLGIDLENLESMALGPQLPDGSQSLLLVSNQEGQSDRPTQFCLLSLQRHARSRA